MMPSIKTRHPKRIRNIYLQALLIHLLSCEDLRALNPFVKSSNHHLRLESTGSRLVARLSCPENEEGKHRVKVKSSLTTTGGEAVRGALMEVKGPPVKCLESDLQECSSTAESLIKDPGLIFPDKPTTLDRVCNMWDKLTLCIDNYTRKCYTRSEKVKFDRLFKDSISAMTVVCTDQSYRNDYLKYAPCVKRVTTEGEFCGFPYQVLINQISNPGVTMKQLCCARTKFKSCILTKTKEVCDDGKGNNPAGEQVPIGSAKPMNITTFAQQVVDKSLAFIAQQCANIKSGSEDCEMGNPVLLRPNSKGPVTENEEFLQSDASYPPRPSTGFVTISTKQTGQKGSGNSWSGDNSIAPKEKRPSDFNFQGTGGSKQGSSQTTVTGLIPHGTEAKGVGKPVNDQLKVHNGPGDLEHGRNQKSKGNQIGSFSHLLVSLGVARLVLG